MADLCMNQIQVALLSIFVTLIGTIRFKRFECTADWVVCLLREGVKKLLIAEWSVNRGGGSTPCPKFFSFIRNIRLDRSVKPQSILIRPIDLIPCFSIAHFIKPYRDPVHL